MMLQWIEDDSYGFSMVFPPFSDPIEELGK
jgi:hypothetical protein